MYTNFSNDNVETGQISADFIKNFISILNKLNISHHAITQMKIWACHLIV